MTEGDFVDLKAVCETKQGQILQENYNSNLENSHRKRNIIVSKYVYKVNLGPSGHVNNYKVLYMAI